MKLLLIGDPHAKTEDLNDVQALVDLISSVAKEEKPEFIIWLGDLFHTHSLVHLPVLQFWEKSFKRLNSEGHKQLALVGNHDLAGNGDPTCHSLIPFSDLISVVDFRTILFDNDGLSPASGQDGPILLLPYIESADEFIERAKDPQCKTLICHQTFEGSKYENGFYAKDGVDPELLAQKLVISGHIHSPQSFDKIFYPGAPRWMTRSDAEVEDRHIWILDIVDGEIKDKKTFSTSSSCRVIKHLIDTPDAPVDLDSLDLEKDKIIIDIVGPTVYVETRKKELARSRISLRVFPNDLVKVTVRESEGIDVAFKKYFEAFRSKNGTKLDTLACLVRERLHVLV